MGQSTIKLNKNNIVDKEDCLSKIVKCAICGKEFKQLPMHIVSKHQMSVREYKEIYPQSELKSEELIARHSAILKEKHKSGEIKAWNKGVIGYTCKYTPEVKKKWLEKNRKKRLEWWIKYPEQKLKYSNRIFGNKNKAKSPEVREKIRKTTIWKYKNDPDYIKHHKEGRVKWREKMRQRKKLYSKIELTLYKQINRLFPGLFYHNSKDKIVRILGYMPDFISFKLMIIIELHGDYWHKRKEIVEHDKVRLKKLQSLSFKVIIVEENELKNIQKLEERLYLEVKI